MAIGLKPRGRHPEKRLSPPAVRSLRPGRHADGNGLYLIVDPSGARRWLLRTVVQGARRDIGLGGTSTVPLAEARELAGKLRKVARSGGDPVAVRDLDKRTSMTFEEAARQVHAQQVAPTSRNAKHKAQWLSTLAAYVLPLIGSKPVHAVEQSDVLRVLAPIWTEKPETARRVKQRVRTVLDWARAAGQREGVNPVEGVEKGLAKQRDRARHFLALPWRELPELMPRLQAAKGMGALGLRFAILTAARSGEVRDATWGEIDVDRAIWTVPAERMKGEREHRVPLSEPAMAVLEQVSGFASGESSLLFPGAKRGRPLSDMSLSAVLKRLGVPVTVHGFRSTFRDWAEEATSFSHEVKEAALAHTIKNKAEAAYRRTDHIEKRREMMDAWASYATGPGADVVRLGV